MKLLVACDAFLFGALFFASALIRVGATEFPHRLLGPGPAMANTVVLAAAVILVARARRAAATGPPIISARRLLRYSAFLGALFIVLKAFEYGSKLSHGLEPSSSTFYALYFLLTGVHALHVLGASVVAAYLGVTGAGATNGDIPRFANHVSVLALLWHVVALVWVAIFVAFYMP